MSLGRRGRDDERTREAEKLREAVASQLGLLVCTSSGVTFHPLPAAGTLVLGRSETSDVPFDDDSISRRHAALHVQGSTITIEDLGSRNGTVVHGAKLSEGVRRSLALGSVVEIGSVTVVVQRATGALASAARSAPAPAAEDAPAAVMRDVTMRRLYQMVDVVAPSTLPVLVLGETGVGKEIFAETIHRRSARPVGPFLRLNCAALPETLLEGELFGYERGAFTGAHQAKAGLFESADGGTVFLDEVGELTLATQAKLLRLLENGEVMRLGSLKPTVVDIRFVSATNRDLEQRVAEGAFRADLFFRVNGVSFTLPPLRERKDDIVPLAELFASRACAKTRRKVPTLDPAARAALEAYPWPGNIRELRNVIERSVLLSTEARLTADVLDLRARPARFSTPPSTPGVNLRSEMETIEKQKILDALERCGGNQSAAAKALGIGRRTLIDKLDAYGLPRPRKR
jgi:transcriptional regulator with PAS, ATPase and Fis domain